MARGDEHRAKAAELSKRAALEGRPSVRAELEALSLSYLRLADQADRNATADIVYETPPPRAQQPITQQQQQPQPPDPENDGER